MLAQNSSAYTFLNEKYPDSLPLAPDWTNTATSKRTWERSLADYRRQLQSLAYIFETMEDEYYPE